MSVAQLETILRDLPGHATPLRVDQEREVWRFESGGKAFYLRFYPRPTSLLKRLRGNRALREFQRLQWLQKAKIPAVRAIAMLAGYTVNAVKGDALIVEGVEPSVPLDRYFNGFEREGRDAPDHREIARQVRELVRAIGLAGYGHEDLHLGRMLRRENGKVLLLDAAGLTQGWWKMPQLLRLAHHVDRYATRGDLRRAWTVLAQGREMPALNSQGPALRRRAAGLCRGDNACFGHGMIAGWQARFFKQWALPFRWSAASAMRITREDWELQWPAILQAMAQGKLATLKSSSSGDVFAAQITLGGRAIEVVIKRPFRKHWYRYVNEIGRGSRAARAWKKAWHLIARELPTAWPLALFERKVLGYTVDQVIVCERVPGPTLYEADLTRYSAAQRQTLFRRCGHILRRIETTGLSQFDSKSTNWIIQPDQVRGPTPVMVDVDGVRFYRWDTFGIQRLLRSMRDHPAYTVEDSLNLCQGYAPLSRMEPEVQDE